jgi:hypothetical protein
MTHLTVRQHLRCMLAACTRPYCTTTHCVFVVTPPPAVPPGFYLKSPGQVAPCPKGEWKSGTASSGNCIKCARGVTTLSEGSESEADCKGGSEQGARTRRPVGPPVKGATSPCRAWKPGRVTLQPTAPSANWVPRCHSKIKWKDWRRPKALAILGMALMNIPRGAGKGPVSGGEGGDLGSNRSSPSDAVLVRRSCTSG